MRYSGSIPYHVHDVDMVGNHSFSWACPSENTKATCPTTVSKRDVTSARFEEEKALREKLAATKNREVQ